MRLGVQNLATNKPDSVAVELKIKNFIKHPEYNSNDNLNDIALIELDETVKFDKKLLRPACLQQQEYFGSNATAVWKNFHCCQIFCNLTFSDWLG